MKYVRMLRGSKIQMNFPYKKPVSTVLYNIALGLLNHLDLTSLLEMIVIEAAKLVKTKHGYYNLVELESNQMIRKVGTGVYKNDIDRVMSLKQGLTQQTIETGEITIVDDYTVSSQPKDPYFDKVRAEIQVPIKVESKIIGVLGLSLVGSNRTFTRTERVVLQQLAAIASISICNAKLYSAAQKEHKERKKVQENLELITDNMPDIIAKLNKDGIIEYINPSCEQLTGYDSHQLTGRCFFDFVHPDDLEKAVDSYASLLKNGEPCNVCHCYINASGQNKWLESRRKKLYKDGIVIGAVFIAQDVTDRIQAEKEAKILEANYQAIISENESTKERIYHLVNFDELTNLPNRTLFNDRLHIALAHAKRNREKLAVLFFDLDRFKTINDSLGYRIGDVILQEVAERLKLCIRDEDTLCRMGADEFVIALTDIEKSSNMTKIVSRMIAALSMPYVIGEVELRITSSIGIAFYPDNGHTPEMLIKHAEIAMYHAKGNGRNNYQYFTESLNDVATERLSLENSLRLAIERNEFVLYYQPQINIRTNKIIGVEALIRWIHPQNGLVSPTKFISVAEETGLIIPIGEWVLREVCRQHLSWIDFGLPAIQIAINVSAIQFQDKQFLLTIQEIIKSCKIDPAYLELELTEGIIMKDANLVIKELHFLKTLGVKLSIDDFGTGYSSLQYLSQLPIDKLKIDQSFIKAMIIEPSSLAIVETIISLAEKLKINVIAEGVETKEEANKIGQCGCEEVQGYYFSKPLPAHEFIEWYYDR